MDEKEALIKELLILKELKARECLDDLYLFNKYVMKWPDISWIPHKKLCDFVCYHKKQKQLILLPRGHLKTSMITIGYTCQQIAKNPHIRVLLANATHEMACSFLRQIKAIFQKNEAFRFFYGDFAQNAEKWTETMVTISKGERSFEKKEPTVTAYGIGGNLVSQHYDLIILDDVVNRENSSTKEQIDKVILLYKDILDLLEPDGHLIVIGCLVAGTKILMADGTLKDIEKIKVGEKVVSYGSIETVEAVIPQGKAKVYELKTRNHTIRATANHPFLTKDGFKRLDNLKRGDKVRIYRYSSLRKLRGKFSEDDMWILGFMLGDGWITENPDKKYGSMRLITCFAKGVHKETNETALRILGRFGKFKETKGGYYRTENIAVGRYLRRLGFKGKAKTKRIPKYVFGLSARLREAFLKGFLAADGYESNGLRCVELTNRELVRDLKNLAELCGYKVSNIHSRTRLIQAPCSPKPVLSTTYQISIGNRKKRIKWDWETVVSIKYVGKKEVYDLTVSNTHNFVAEGMVVHNTRWHFNDLYGWILDPLNGVRDDFEILIGRAYYGEFGKSDKILFPKKFNWDILRELKRQKGNYEFNCTPAGTPILMADWSFKPIEKVKKGDYVVGFVKGNLEHKHRLVKSKVLHTMKRKNDIVYDLKMESGRKVACTSDHRWYSGREDGTHRLYVEPKKGRKLMFVCPTTNSVSQEEEKLWAYLAGLFDADGSTKSGGCFNISQGMGNEEVVNRIREVLRKLNIPFTEKVRKRRVKKPVLTFHLRGGFETKLKLLRLGNPAKKSQIIKDLFRKSSRFIKSKDRIVDMRAREKPEVTYALETETGNYIAWGYASSNCQYLNRPVDPETAAFKRKWFKYWDEDMIKGRLLHNFVTIDPAIGLTRESDYTVILTVSVDIFNNWYIREIDRGRYNPRQLIERIFLADDKWKPLKIGLEQVAFQKTLQYTINDEMRRRNHFLPILELKPGTQKSKEDRIRGLQPRYETGTIYHNKFIENNDWLEEELTRFPKGKHDDIIDALSYMLQVAFPPKRKKPIREGRKSRPYLY